MTPDRRRGATACGQTCAEGEPLPGPVCGGCADPNGQTPSGECAVFRCCVLERGLEHCGVCLDFPCQVFLCQAEPTTVARRYRSLARRAEIGTEAWLAERRGACR